MFNQSTQSIIIFTVCVVSLLILFCTFIVTIIYRYQKKQHSFYKELEELKIAHENEILRAQLEMQEYTFQNISREIHDNIGQKLSLAKLYLNTMPDSRNSHPRISESEGIISEAIDDLSDIARSMNSEIILNNGLVKGMEFEVMQLKKAGIYEIFTAFTDDPILLDIKKELVLFRIFQECLHNIVKHSEATAIDISLEYFDNYLCLSIKDNGKGFVKERKKDGSGLINIRNRASLLGGDVSIESGPGGTRVTISILTNKYTYDQESYNGG